jgi:hypothetical protein
MLRGTMNHRFSSLLLSDRKNVRVVASFGQAQLVEAEGKWVLRGATPSEVTEAREWISLFYHEAVPLIVCNSQTED